MDSQFQGKVALVTGGNSGLGKASALSLARAGARVVISGRRAAEGEQVAQLIKHEGGEAVFIRADMSLKPDIEAVVAQTIRKYGRLDCAINNAGVEGTVFVPTADYSEDTWDEVININLKAVWLCMKYEIPHLLQQKGSSIVNMSSVAGLVGGPVGAAYHASKHGVIGPHASRGNGVCRPRITRQRGGAGGDSHGDDRARQLSHCRARAAADCHASNGPVRKTGRGWQCGGLVMFRRRVFHHGTRFAGRRRLCGTLASLWGEMARG